MEQAELNPCKCGCGELVAGTWKRGHAKRGEGGGRLLPGPQDDLPPEEFGNIIDIDDVSSRPSPAGPPESSPPAGGPAPEPGDDEPPGHAKRDWGKPGRKTRGRPAASPRITAAIRGDIDAKISFVLEIPGRIWQARDPLCGGVFVEQRPEIASALTEIVCQSPDLVNWFAGGGGQFMLFLNLTATLWPVVTVVMAHHVYHSIETAPDGSLASGPPDYREYAA